MEIETASTCRRAARLAALLVLAAGLVGASGAAAQDLDSLCDKVLELRKGQWAEYKMKGVSPGGAARMRIAIIGTQEVAGQKAWWVELQMKGGENSMTTQVLAGGYPFRSDQVHEMVIKAGDQPAMKMPRQGLAMMRAQMGVPPNMGAADRCRKAKIVGWESVTVPAGTFRALRIESADDPKADVWASEEIPFGMIKVVHADGEIALVGHGMDAKSSIRETPIAVPGFGG